MRKSVLIVPVLLALALATSISPVLANEAPHPSGLTASGYGYVRDSCMRYRGRATLTFLYVPAADDCHEEGWLVLITVKETSFVWYVSRTKNWGPFKIWMCKPHPEVGDLNLLQGPARIKVVVIHPEDGARMVYARGYGVFFIGKP